MTVWVVTFLTMSRVVALELFALTGSRPGCGMARMRAMRYVRNVVTAGIFVVRMGGKVLGRRTFMTRLDVRDVMTVVVVFLVKAVVMRSGV